MVTVLELNAAVTPAGSPVAVPIPVAPVVEWVMFDKTLFLHRVGLAEAALTVFSGFTVTVVLPEAVHPNALVVTTVYVVVTLGLCDPRF